MDLQLATLRDISNELLQRDLKFMLLAEEQTNDLSENRVWVSANGIGRRDVIRLAHLGRLSFMESDHRPRPGRSKDWHRPKE